MKKLICVLLLVGISIPKMKSQEVFLDLSSTDLAFSLKAIDGYLYTGLYGSGTIGRFNLNNPQVNPEIVAEGFAINSPYFFGYDATTNELYVSVIPAGNDYFQKVSLNDSFPTTGEVIPINIPNLFWGLEVYNDTIFIVSNDISNNVGILLKMNTTQGPSSLETIIEDPSMRVYHTRIYDDELYFIGQQNNPVQYNLYKINPNENNPTPELVSNNVSDSFVQDMHISNGIIYLGTITDEIIKLNLNTSPLQPETIYNNLGGDVVGIASSGTNVYVSTDLNRTIWTFEDPDLSVAETSNSKIALYPNPVKNRIYLQGLSGETTYTIHSALGTLISTGVYKNEGIHVSGLKQGIYFVEIESNGQIITKKFIKN